MEHVNVMKSECTAMDSTRSAAIKNHETFLWRARSELESRSNGAGDGTPALSKPAPAPVSVG